MSRRSTRLPGADALFGDNLAGSEANAGVPETLNSEEPEKTNSGNPETTIQPKTTVDVARPEKYSTLLHSEVICDIDDVRLRLRRQHNVRLAKWEILNAVLQDALKDRERVLELLLAHKSKN